MGIIMFLNRYNRIKLAKQDINTYPLHRRFKYAIFAILSLEFLSLSLSEEKKTTVRPQQICLTAEGGG